MNARPINKRRSLHGEFVAFQETFKEVKDIDLETFDLSLKNLNAPEQDPLREPGEILAEISALDAESAEILEAIGGMLWSWQ